MDEEKEKSKDEIKKLVKTQQKKQSRGKQQKSQSQQSQPQQQQQSQPQQQQQSQPQQSQPQQSQPQQSQQSQQQPPLSQQQRQNNTEEGKGPSPTMVSINLGFLEAVHNILLAANKRCHWEPNELVPVGRMISELSNIVTYYSQPRNQQEQLTGGTSTSESS